MEAVPASYFGEIRRNARSLAAAALGSGGGLMLMSYTTTIFGPYLVRTFGWSRSQFALIGLAMFSTLIALPFIGRLTDRFGVRRTALVGVLGIPACLSAYSFMSGSFPTYFAISCMILALGSFTSPVVYTRLIAADFDKARGLALTFVTIAPALLGAIAAPLLTAVIDAWGWRVGYRTLAVFVLVCGLTALALVPPHDRDGVAGARVHVATVRADYGAILRSGSFWMIFVAMLLCTLQTPLHSSQMALMLHDNHLGSGAVAGMISIYGLGTVIGRVGCGLALDRFSAPVVAAISMLPPALGYALLASSVDTTVVIGAAMFMVGFAVGAEGDLQSFLVARYFPLRIFSTTLSLVYCGVFAASALGALLLSVLLRTSDSFAPFLMVVACAIALGSLVFLMLPRGRTAPGSDAGDDPSSRTVPALEMQ
ncbi:MFS transporter [Novosphingobium sp. fls2-241-R2A-195]|jgi:MFS family permease|uniref:MFS transporter n=1 Tax=Novosphingobium sp. fls2-241-R2A-195 TaxID=3040296 RepID=UPI00254E34CD|nr:MFS transporter [Novosphingobium sp. fls2-241-R2A-195]